MDFKDYINELSNLDNQEARTELSTFYTLNASIFKYFKVVDETILGLLSLPNISVTAHIQFEKTLPHLIKLRNTILNLASSDIAQNYEDKIRTSIDYIRGMMALNEVENIATNFYQLLDSNKKALNVEITNSLEEEYKRATKLEIEKRNEIEFKITTIQDAEGFLKKFGVECCEWKTLQMIAKASVNKNILKKITEFTTDYWDTICYSEDVDEVKDKYELYSLVKILKLNTNLSANLRQLLEDCSLDIESELG